MQGFRPLWLLLPLAILLVLYLFRLKREAKARQLLASSSSKVKIYFAEGKTWNHEGLTVAAVNNQKPLIAKDAGGNYIVVDAGENLVLMRHMCSGHVLHEEKVSLLAEPGHGYGIYFNKESTEFFVKKDVTHYQYNGF